MAGIVSSVKRSKMMAGIGSKILGLKSRFVNCYIGGVIGSECIAKIYVAAQTPSCLATEPLCL